MGDSASTKIGLNREADLLELA